MADDVLEGACTCMCICILFLAAPIAFLSVSLVTHDPKLYVNDLYISALNTTTNSNSNATRVNTFIFIDLQLSNVMYLNGLRYKGFNLTFFYGGNRSFPVADGTIAGFYQGARKKTHRSAVVRTRGLPWEDAFDRISRGMTVDFAVELATTVKLRQCGAFRKRKAMLVAADVSFDGSGDEIDDKPIRLT